LLPNVQLLLLLKRRLQSERRIAEITLLATLIKECWIVSYGHWRAASAHNLERIAQDSLENAWMQGRSAAAKQEQISGHSPTQDGGELRIRNNHGD
jgi:hypothetical protein